MIYNVSFPGLGLSLAVNPVAFEFFGVTIRWYGILLALAFLLAFLYCAKRSKEFKISGSEFADYTLFAAISAIIGTRLYYVIFYPGGYYFRNPWQILNISEGGIAIYGAIIGGVLGVFILWLIKKKTTNLKSLLDLMSLGLLIGQTIGRWGNFTNQEAFGTPANMPWAMISQATGEEAVHPCFLYESFGCLVLFLILHFYSKRSKNPGNVFLLCTLGYGILRIFIEGLRTDSLIIPLTGLRVSQVTAGVFAGVSLVFLLLRHKRH